MGIEKFPVLGYIYSIEKLEKVEIENGEPGNEKNTASNGNRSGTGFPWISLPVVPVSLWRRSKTWPRICLLTVKPSSNRNLLK